MIRTHLDLCSGIGGFALAARWAGYTTIGFCEIDPWCRQVLAKNFPGVPQHDDLTTMEPAAVAGWIGERRLDVITAGYPCQPFSLAGSRLGSADSRHLWPTISRIVADVRPRWCLFENVAGHVSMGLDTVFDDLESLGYAAWATIVPASAVGAPHRRDRVWIVAADERGMVDTDGGDCGRGVFAVGADGGAQSPVAGGEPDRADGAADVADASGWQNNRRERGILASATGARGCGDASACACSKDVADADDAGCEDQWRPVTDGAELAAAERGGCDGAGDEAVGGVGDAADGVSGWVARPRRAGHPWAADWEKDCPRVVTDERDRRRKLHGLGNAIVPQVAYEILRAIRIADADEGEGE